GNWFPRAVRHGQPAPLLFHGIRKTASVRLAQAGCTAHEIAAITGQASRKEIVRYTLRRSTASVLPPRRWRRPKAVHPVSNPSQVRQEMEKIVRNQMAKPVAPRAGFEPATNRLTAGCSTTELPGNRRSSRAAGSRAAKQPCRRITNASRLSKG